MVDACVVREMFSAAFAPAARGISTLPASDHAVEIALKEAKHAHG